MNNGQQIIRYLEELTQVLVDLQVTTPFYILIAGGAFMLLQEKRKSTEDIDFAILEPVQVHNPQTTLQVVIRKAEISRHGVPNAEEFQQAIAIVARRHRNLPEDWLNDEAAVYYYDDAPNADVTYWRSFKNILHVFLPTLEYMFATKMAAYRPKDANDILILMKELEITTLDEAKAIVDRFLLPDAQEFWEIDDKLSELFP